MTLPTEEPIHSQPYSLPHEMQKEVSDVVFAVIIRKPDGSNKVCVDFVNLIRLQSLTINWCHNMSLILWVK